jgi:predicted PurR-regulated permease PerM
MNILTALLCFSIGVVVQSLVIWVATKIVRLVCSIRQALLISVICNLLVFIPMVGIFVSVITFFVLLSKWLEADAVDAVLVRIGHARASVCDRFYSKVI